MNERITAALIGALATILVTGIGFLARDIIQARTARRREQRQFAIALQAEIAYNVRDLEDFLRDSVDMDVVRALIKETGAPPHVTDAKHTRIYSGNIARLFTFRSVTIGSVVEFYSHLDKLENQIAGLQLESFRGISEGGKIATVQYIFDVAKLSIDYGKIAEQQVAQEIYELKRSWF